jgi:hypothetical protein
MLHVELNHILTEDDALGRIKDIFTVVENDRELYVVTKNGAPIFAIVDIESLTQDLPSLNVTATPTQAPVPTVATPPIPEPVISPVFSPVFDPMPKPTEEVVQPVVDTLPPMPSLNTPTEEPAAPSFSTFSPGNLPPLSGTEHLASTPPSAPVSNPAPTTDTVPLSAAPHIKPPIVDAISTDPRNSSPLA